MKICVIIEVEDVNTCVRGNNIAIVTQLIDVIFTPEAMEELILDYALTKKGNGNRNK